MSLHLNQINHAVLNIKYVDLNKLVAVLTDRSVFVVFVLATYGEGEPPDSAYMFLENLKMLHTKLYNLTYVIFGLGNSMYTYFNECAKIFHYQLSRVGAKNNLMSNCFSDELYDMESTFSNWQEKLIEKLLEIDDIGISKKAFTNNNGRVYCLHLIPTKWYLSKLKNILNIFSNVQPAFSDHVDEKIFIYPVSVNRELYIDCDRSCRHIELHIDKSNFKYKSGDHIGILASNPKCLVEKIGLLLNINLDQWISLNAINPLNFMKHPFPCPCTYRTAFTHYVDITGPPPRSLFLSGLNYVTDIREMELVKLLGSNTDDGKKYYAEWIVKEYRGLVDVLMELATFRPSADLVLESLNVLKPRLYSISSSNMVHPDCIHMTVGVVQHSIANTDRNFKGLCSNWLQSIGGNSNIFGLKINEQIPVYLHPSKFCLPRSRTIPIIMCAAGTGLAPFRAFIQERAFVAQTKGGKIGKTLLFFGCRHKEDFIYSNELKSFCDLGLLELHVAFSRSGNKKIYVQDKLEENKELIWSLLDRSHAHFYICGNAKTLACGVYKRLIEIISNCTNGSVDSAEKYILNLRKEGRYSVDIWS